MKSAWVRKSIFETRLQKCINEMARKTTDVVAAAFLNGKAKKDANNHTDGKVFYLHSNPIAKIENGNLWITDSGWATATTRERLNGIMAAASINKGVRQSGGKQMLDGEPWDGEWINVGKISRPAMESITESEHLHFSNNTDTVDIGDKSIGISSDGMYDNRGLHIQIRHNRDKDLFEKANAMAKIIIQALNGKIEK